MHPPPLPEGEGWGEGSGRPSSRPLSHGSRLGQNLGMGHFVVVWEIAGQARNDEEHGSQRLTRRMTTPRCTLSAGALLQYALCVGLALAMGRLPSLVSIIFL